MLYCKNCNSEITMSAVYCQKCGAPIELEKKIWDIYSLMLINAFPQYTYIIRSHYNSLDINFYLSRMEQMNLVFKNKEGEYELVEDRKIDVLLSHLLHKEKVATLRRTFYMAFLITSFFIYLIYVTFLPQEPNTIIYFSLSFLLFSLIAFTLEAIYRFRLMKFIEKIHVARSKGF